MILRSLRILSLLALLPATLSAEDIRTWKVITGGHFEAKLKSAESTYVLLENSEGDVAKFPLSDLQPSDREYVRDWVATQTPADDSSADGTFAEKVYGSLLYFDGEKLAPYEPKATDETKYFAFYKSALWCPPCRTFTPKLVKFYNQQKEKGAPIELIFISYDSNKKAMAEYMEKYKMPFPAFKHKRNRDIVSSKGEGIPNLIVTNANGRKLLDSYNRSGEYIGPDEVLEAFEKLLEK